MLWNNLSYEAKATQSISTPSLVSLKYMYSIMYTLYTREFRMKRQEVQGWLTGSFSAANFKCFNPCFFAFLILSCNKICSSSWVTHLKCMLRILLRSSYLLLVHLWNKISKMQSYSQTLNYTCSNLFYTCKSSHTWVTARHQSLNQTTYNIAFCCDFLSGWL